MSKSPVLKCLLVSVLLAFVFMIPDTSAHNQSTAAQTVDIYISNLFMGDVQGIQKLISGNMLAKKRQIVQNPDSYARFLKRHYEGGSADIYKTKEYGEHVHAHVLFHHPTSQPSEIIFVLEHIGDHWMIINEKY